MVKLFTPPKTDLVDKEVLDGVEEPPDKSGLRYSSRHREELAVHLKNTEDITEMMAKVRIAESNNSVKVAETTHVMPIRTYMRYFTVNAVLLVAFLVFIALLTTKLGLVDTRVFVALIAAATVVLGVPIVMVARKLLNSVLPDDGVDASK